MIGRFYLAVFLVILLFGSNTWVVTPRMSLILGIFQQRVARRLSGIQLKILTYGSWEYPLTKGALQEAGLETMETYISRCYNMVTQYIST